MWLIDGYKNKPLTIHQITIQLKLSPCHYNIAYPMTAKQQAIQDIRNDALFKAHKKNAQFVDKSTKTLHSYGTVQPGTNLFVKK